MPDPSALAKALRADPMGAQEHQAYLSSVGVPLNPMPQQPQVISRGGQEVMPIPPNVVGLARLLIQTGRATPETALGMAQSMTGGR